MQSLIETIEFGFERRDELTCASEDSELSDAHSRLVERFLFVP